VKRICLLGAAGAMVLILGVASALAATPHASKGGKNKSKTPTTVTSKVSCASSLTLQVAPGATDVTAAATDGTQMGTVACGPSRGAAWESFTTADSGDLTGKWQSWFNTGSIYGTFTLTPSDNNPPTTTSTFTQASYAGTFIIKNGTGAYAKATGTGTMKCSTKDAVHFTCKQNGKITLPAPTTTKGKKS
jgi:hypothetical protein